MRSTLAAQPANTSVKASSPVKLSGGSPASPYVSLDALSVRTQGEILAQPRRHTLSFANVPLFAPGEALPVQRKLAVGLANDPLEREADLAADRVMRTPQETAAVWSSSPLALRRQCACKDSGTPCASCRSEEDLLRRKPTSGSTHTGPAHTSPTQSGPAQSGPAQSVAPPAVHEALQRSGRPLDAGTRAFMEPRLQYDFSHVRIHADDLAARSASSVNARAYTVGNNVVFGAGQFSPQTNDGRRLLAHELTHVMQQRGSFSAVQRQPVHPDADARRAAAIEAGRYILTRTSDQIEEQDDEEIRLKLDPKKAHSKDYAWKLALEDKAQIEKHHGVPPRLLKDIQVKFRFFREAGNPAYIGVLGGPLSAYPDQALEVISDPVDSSANHDPAALGTEQKGPQPTCDIGKKQFLLQYEGEPEKSRCMGPDDPEFRNVFDQRIKRAVGFTTGGTTWENVTYDRFRVMLLFYDNGTSEYFPLTEVGDFYYGKGVSAARVPTFYKRKNGLVYPVANNRVYFNEALTPNIYAYKNGLRYQVTEMQRLYELLQTAGAFAQIIAMNAATEDFKQSVLGFRRGGESELLIGGVRQKSRSGGGDISNGVPMHLDDAAGAATHPAGRSGASRGAGGGGDVSNGVPMHIDDAAGAATHPAGRSGAHSGTGGGDHNGTSNGVPTHIDDAAGAGTQPAGRSSAQRGTGGGGDTDTSNGVPKSTNDAPTARIRPGERFGVTYGEYNFSGEKRLNGDTYEMDVWMLNRQGGAGGNDKSTASSIVPIKNLAREFGAEAQAQGATRLKVTGRAVTNDNVRAINLLAKLYGGTSRVIDQRTVEIIVPIPLVERRGF